MVAVITPQYSISALDKEGGGENVNACERKSNHGDDCDGERWK